MPTPVVDVKASPDDSVLSETTAAEKSTSSLATTYTPLSPPTTPEVRNVPLEPSLTAPTPLDHLWYPDLIDTIISYSSLSTLQAFRSTCRSYRDKLAPIIYENCILDGTKGGRLYATDMRAPPSKELVRMPSTDAAAPLLAHLRTLEIVGPIAPSLLPTPLSTCRLHTLRLRPDDRLVATDFPSTDKLVLLGDISFRSRIRPKGIKKIVHSNPTLHTINTLHSFATVYEGVVPHVVVILKCPISATASVKARKPEILRRTLALFIVLLLSAGCTGGGDCRRQVTVVGLDSIEPRLMGLFGTAGPVEALKQYIAEDHSAHVLTSLFGADSQELLDSVEYLTLEEYSKTLTPEELATEIMA